MRFVSFMRIGVDPISIMPVFGQTIEELNRHKAHLANCGGQWTDIDLNSNANPADCRRLTSADYFAAYPLPVVASPFEGMTEVAE